MPYRLDINKNGGGIIIYVREDIPTKILTKHNLPEDIEGIFLEINFESSNGYSVEFIIHFLRMINTFLVI